MFEFATATKIIFGSGSVQELKKITAVGRFPLLIGNGPGVEFVANLLPEGMKAFGPIWIDREPTIDLISDITQQARARGCDCVVAVGGGSALDAGKAVAALLTNSGELLDYLEVVGLAKPLIHPSVPMIAVPTTAGTGSEVTKNAVLAVPEKGVKVSLRSPYLFPSLAIVDPELTVKLPSDITASTGMDALTQVIEPYVSIKANRLTDIICLEGAGRISTSIRTAVFNGADLAAREDMSWGSLLGGLALANAGLGAVHGFAAAIGGAFDIPHGVVCANLLPGVVEMNISVCRRDGKIETLGRFVDLARLICKSQSATTEQLVDWLYELKSELKIKPLGDYGIGGMHLSQIVENTLSSSSLKGNPVSLSRSELENILIQAV